MVALATYNEIENLPRIVDEILQALPDADVLVVDDNSPDGTGRWCDERAVTEPRIRCLHRPGKLGLGSATLEAAQRAIDEGYTILITLDADGSHDPRYVVDLVRATDQADVAIGSRYCEGGAIEGWPVGRRVLSRAVNALSRRLLRLPARDTSGAFRAYRVSALQKINLSQVEARGFAYLEELLWRLARSGATFIEVPITFHQRRAGKSKISVHEGAGKIITIGKLTWRGMFDR